jgi:hypothetical protein
MGTTRFESKSDIRNSALALRRQLAAAFSPKTAYGGSVGLVPSHGHCAAVAAILLESLGGELVSASVGGISHWFNRFQIGGRQFDVDITGDQFGRAAVQMAPEGELYPGSRVRARSELDRDTLARAALLRAKAGLVRENRRWSSKSLGGRLNSHTTRRGSKVSQP